MLHASHALVQATVGVGTVIIVYMGVAYTRGGGNFCNKNCAKIFSDLNTIVLHGASLFLFALLASLLDNVESLVGYVLLSCVNIYGLAKVLLLLVCSCSTFCAVISAFDVPCALLSTNLQTGFVNKW